MINNLIKNKHSNLTSHEKLVKLFYISQLLEKEDNFDKNIRKMFHQAIKDGVKLDKIVSIESFNENELADLLNEPIVNFINY
jgi:hypothetical protein